MQIVYDDKTYTLDLEDIDVDQARKIKSEFGLTLKGLEEGFAEGDSDAVVAMYWIMLAQNGEDHAIRTLKVKPVKYIRAVTAALVADQAAKAAETPKDDGASL